MAKAGTALIALAATAAYLGLAVWGRGGFEAFFAHPALTATTVVTFLLAVASLFTSGNLSAGEQEDRGNRWVLIVFFVVGIADGFLPAYCDRTGLLTFDGEAARWTGVALFAAGGVLRIWPVFVLGRRFSGLVAIQPGHALVTDGIFGVIRNPSYLGMVVMVFGWALVFRSWIGVLLAALMIPPLIARIRAEETLLAGQFGEAYAAYRARTWRLVPGLY